MNAEPNSFQSIGAVSAAIVDRWSWYFAALKDPSSIGKTLIASESDPQQGYYRTRRKDGPWEAVAIFYPENSDQLVAYRGGQEVRDINQVWVWCLRYPITFEAYQKAMAGGGFDDEPPAAPEPTIGHNSGDADPFDALKIELAGEAEMADEFLRSEVKSQADADKAGIWSKRLADLSKRADGEREREKAPHLQAGRDVDDKWRPVIGDAKDLSAKLKKHVEPFLIAQKRAEEERARKAREEAERLRREAEEKARAEASKIATGIADAAAIAEHNARAEAERAELLRKAQEAEKAAEAKNASAGRTGARVSIRTEKRAKVVDYKAAALALVDAKHKDMIATIDQLAQRAVKAGVPLAGVEVEEVEKVV